MRCWKRFRNIVVSNSFGDLKRHFMTFHDLSCWTRFMKIVVSNWRALKVIQDSFIFYPKLTHTLVVAYLSYISFGPGMSQSEDVVLIECVDWSSELSFSKGHRGAIFVNSTKKPKLPMLQLSKVGKIDDTVKAPYGVSKPYGGGNGRSSIEMEVEDEATIASIRRFDNFIIEKAFEDKWFGPDHTIEDVQQMYLPIWREPGPEKQRGTIRAKVSTDSVEAPDVFVSSSWDEGTGNVSVYSGTLKDNMHPHTRLIPIMEMSSRVWHMPTNNQFGVTLIIRKLIAFHDPSMQRGEDAFDL